MPIPLLCVHLFLDAILHSAKNSQRDWPLLRIDRVQWMEQQKPKLIALLRIAVVTSEGVALCCAKVDLRHPLLTPMESARVAAGMAEALRDCVGQAVV